MISLYESTPSLSYNHTVREAITNVVVPQNGVAPPADVHASPLVLLDHIFWNKSFTPRTYLVMLRADTDREVDQC